MHGLKSLYVPVLAAVLLGGCSPGTELTVRGQICNQDVDAELTDRKDRAETSIGIQCPGGGGMTYSSTESSTSAVLAEQAKMLGQLTSLVGELLKVAPVSFEQTARMPALAPDAPRPVLRDPLPIAWPMRKPEG